MSYLESITSHAKVTAEHIVDPKVRSKTFIRICMTEALYSRSCAKRTMIEEIDDNMMRGEVLFSIIKEEVKYDIPGAIETLKEIDNETYQLRAFYFLVDYIARRDMQAAVEYIQDPGIVLSNSTDRGFYVLARIEAETDIAAAERTAARIIDESWRSNAEWAILRQEVKINADRALNRALRFEEGPRRVNAFVDIFPDLAKTDLEKAKHVAIKHLGIEI